MTAPARLTPKEALAFFQGFLKRPKEVGSIIPSSRFLEKRIVKSARLGEAKLVVELGPGTGGTTQAVLRALRPDAHLLAVEINPEFVDHMRLHLTDPRLAVHCGSAADIPDALAKHDLDRPDVILSGIPFSTMPRALGLEILQSVHESLPVGGRFVAYQFRDRVETLGRRVFGPADVQTELRNVPPMRVYTWIKTSEEAPVPRPA
ncbi:MAG: methyltransferase domain-containing protein [Proteobacteria bacterium]|nr:methyltransferase domain-containing protein [Pseudomonadota bacterium]